MAHDTGVNVGHEISGQRPTVADQRACGIMATGDGFGAQGISSLQGATCALLCFCAGPQR